MVQGRQSEAGSEEWQDVIKGRTRKMTMGEQRAIPSWVEKSRKDDFVTLLLGESKHKIMRILLEGDETAEHMAKTLHMNVSAARKHVDALEKRSLVRSHFERADVGRPKKIYGITEEGRELFAKKYDVFLVSLLDKLSSTDPSFARQIVRELAFEIGREMKASLPRRMSDEERISRMVQILNDVGFSAKAEEVENGEGKRKTLRIVRTNCAILRAAKSHPDLVCKVFDTSLLSSVLGQDVALVETMACGARRCVHDVGSKVTEV